jgi:hypothetical protein
LNLKKAAFASIFALVLSTVVSLPSSAATVHPTFVVGTSSSANDLKLDVNASIAGVSVSYRVGGVTAATFSNGVRSTTNIQTYLLKVSSAVNETIFTRGADPFAPGTYISRDTGIANSQVTMAGGSQNFSTVQNARNALGSSYDGLAVICLALTYNPTGSSASDIWHCSSSFQWPSFDNTGYRNALASTTWEQNSVFGGIGTTNSASVTITFDVSNGATWFNVSFGGISVAPIVDSEWDTGNASAASASSAASGLTYRDTASNQVVSITAATRMYLIDQTSGNRTSRLDFYFAENRAGDTSISLQFPAGSLLKTSAEPAIYLSSPLNGGTNMGSPVTYRFGWVLGGGNNNQNNNQNVVSNRPSSTAKYSGPEILAVDNFRPILSGGKLTFTGKNLSAVSSATIGSLAASLSYDATTGLTIGTPAGLAPGKYDLVMQSSFGKLTHINAVTIKAPTPTQTIGFKGEGEYLNEAQVAQLVEFNSSLNADYEKVRCIVNAADAEVAKAIAVRVCAHVARGEARNVEVIQDVRSTYQGSGFWVRVYAKG